MDYNGLKKCQFITALVLIQFIFKAKYDMHHNLDKNVSIWSQKCFLFECFEYRVKSSLWMTNL